MTYAASSARQRVRAAVQRVTYADFTSGTAFDIFSKRKNGHLPVRGYIIVLVPFNSATSASLTIGKRLSGTAASANAYKTAYDLKAASAGDITAFTVVPPYVSDTDGGVTLSGTITVVGAPTAGEFLVVEEYLLDGHEDFSES